MDTLEYNPYDELAGLFPGAKQLAELDEMLEYTHHYKQHLTQQISTDIAAFDLAPQDTLATDVKTLVLAIATVRGEARASEESISTMTLSIQKLDAYKRNLVSLMTVVKRLQMLISAHSTLTATIGTKNYLEILPLLLVIKELLVFFKPYRLIKEINAIHLEVQTTQNKLTSDIMLDFEEIMTTPNVSGDLVAGCLILELVDPKSKDRVLSQFYNVQLKDIKLVFGGHDEAGSLDNFNRRYIYFGTTLDTLEEKYSKVFPPEWRVGVELAKVFCHISKQDLERLLAHTTALPSILDNLAASIEFERQLNQRFDTNEFSTVLLRVFENHLLIWITEQDRVLSTKINELLGMPFLPTELDVHSAGELATVLQTNSVPNIANSLLELVKHLQKTLSQILKLSHGSILIDVARLFIKYVGEYNARALAPMIPTDDNNIAAVDVIKYLTAVVNTGDYLLGSLDDLLAKMAKKYLGPWPLADTVTDLVHSTINRLIQYLVGQVGTDLRPVWRQLSNQNWQLELAAGELGYVADLSKAVRDTVRLVLPLIIRDSYTRNFCDRVVEMVVAAFTAQLVGLAPVPVLAVERLQNDVAAIKEVMLLLPMYADANYQPGSTAPAPSRLYVKHVTNQFNSLEALLRVLATPALPVEEFARIYIDSIDQLVPNFIKVLQLKGVDHHKKYVDAFKLLRADDLPPANPLLLGLDSRPATPAQDTDFDLSPTPEVKSPRLMPAKILNMGETHVAKFNKSFGKFFRKDE